MNIGSARAVVAATVLILCGASAFAQPRPAPIAVKPFRGRYCASLGPAGWAVIAENAQRVAFGADFSNGDGTAFAGYSIFGGGALSAGMPGYDTPDHAVASSLSNMGRTQTRFSNRQQLGPNVFLIEYQNATGRGVGFWQVIPTGRGFMIVLRTAGTTHAQWQRRAGEAMAVARSLRCQVPNVPPGPDPPSLNAKSKKGGEGDSMYNQWLEKEYYHNSQTGENYWVSPSQDWVQNGPQGPGYYAQHGNGAVKLDPGYSQ